MTYYQRNKERIRNYERKRREQLRLEKQTQQQKIENLKNTIEADKLETIEGNYLFTKVFRINTTPDKIKELEKKEDNIQKQINNIIHKQNINGMAICVVNHYPSKADNKYMITRELYINKKETNENNLNMIYNLYTSI